MNDEIHATPALAAEFVPMAPCPASDAAPCGLRSLGIARLVAALAAARIGFESVAKNRDNPHLKSRYANLTAYIEAAAPALAGQGLAVMQMPRPAAGGGLELFTMLAHKSGEWIASILPLPDGRGNPQQFGSSMTYMKRYALGGMLLLSADEEDDDGEASSLAFQIQGRRWPAAQGQAPRREPRAADDQQPAYVFKIVRPGAPDAVRNKPDRYVQLWRDAIESMREKPIEFAKMVEANAENFDQLAKDGHGAVVEAVKELLVEETKRATAAKAAAPKGE